MIIPVRCFTCGRVIGSDYLKWTEAVDQGKDPKRTLDELGVKRFCCRRMIISHVDLLKEAAVYE